MKFRQFPVGDGCGRRRRGCDRGSLAEVLESRTLLAYAPPVRGPLPADADSVSGPVTAALAAPPAGTTKMWDGGAGTLSWHDAANWAPDGVPGPADVAWVPDQSPNIAVSYSSGTSSITGLVCEETLAVSGGSLSITGSASVAARLQMTGGVLGGNAALTVTDLLNWNAGTISGGGPAQGALVFAPGAIAFSTPTSGSNALSGRTIRNESILALQGTLAMSSGARIDNRGTFQVGGDVTGSTGGSIENGAGGTIAQINAAATLDVPINNAGTVSATGQLSLTGVVENSGTLSATPSGKFLLGRGQSNGRLRAAGPTGAATDSPTAFVFQSGYFSLFDVSSVDIAPGRIFHVAGGGGLTMGGSVTVPELLLEGQVLGGTGITVTRRLTWLGGDLDSPVIIKASPLQSVATGDLSLRFGSIVNEGDLLFHDATLAMYGGTSIDNAGTMEVRNVEVFDARFLGTLNNTGTVRLTGGTNPFRADVVNGGTFELRGGGFGALKFRQLATGTLEVHPGVAGAATGVGQVTVFSSGPSGREEGEGVATLDGTLRVVTDAGFNPVAGVEYPVVTAELRTGRFASVVSAPAGGPVYRARYEDDAVTVHLNGAPVAHDETFTTPEDVPFTLSAPGVFANDVDPDADPLSTAAIDTSFSVGTFALQPDGSLLYTPPANFHGTDLVRYKARDGDLTSAFANVYVTVVSVDDRPVAGNDAYATAEDQPLTVNAPAVLSNDFDPDGGALNVLSFGQGAHGTVAATLPLGSGGFVYTPAANFSGVDTFTYVVRDASGATATGTVTVNVTAVQDAPAAANDTYAVAPGATLAVNAANGVLKNDADPDGDALTAVLLAGPSKGSLALQPNGSFAYTPNAGVSGIDAFIYRATDGVRSSAAASVTINVTSGQPLVTINDVAVTEDAGAVTGAVFTVTLSAVSATAVTMEWATFSGGTDPATAGTDYSAASGVLTIPAGQLTGTIAVAIRPDALAEVPETFFVNVSNAVGATIVDGQGVGTINDDDTPAPRVTAVFVNGTTWTPAWRAYLAGLGMGDATFGYAVPTGAGQLAVLPWAGIDRVSLRFDREVLVLDADLRVRAAGVASGYAILDMDYDQATRTATWTLAQPVRNDKLLLDLDGGADGVIDAAGGVRLDGEWGGTSDVFPSGDGLPGGNFQFRVNVLAGDANRDGRVNGIDWFDLRRRLRRTTASPGAGATGYAVYADVSGDGLIGTEDLLGVRRNLLRTLPAGDVGAGAVAVRAAVLAPTRGYGPVTRSWFGEASIG